MPVSRSVQALLVGARDDLGDGVAVLVVVLGQQAGEVAFQGLAPLGTWKWTWKGRGIRPTPAVECQGRVGFESFSCPYYESHQPKFS